MQEVYDRAAKHPPVKFDRATQLFLLWAINDICSRRRWRLHGVAFDPTHFHSLISWKGGSTWRDVRRTLANVLSTLLGKHTGKPGRRWFGEDPSRKRVRDMPHLRCLLDEYFPKHRGVLWKEGDRPPAPPTKGQP